MEIRAHVVVSGFVQGVGFRYFVFHRATRFGLTGFVRNIFTGEVEIEAEGDRSLIEEFLKEVRIGPRNARVNSVTIDWLNCTNLTKNFEIR